MGLDAAHTIGPRPDQQLGGIAAGLVSKHLRRGAKLLIQRRRASSSVRSVDAAALRLENLIPGAGSRWV